MNRANYRTHPTRTRPGRQVLQVAQANVGKSPPAHTALLQQCWEDHIDVVLVQEPSVTNDGRNRFNSHPGYSAYVPVDGWDGIASQPRVMTYVNKNSRLQTRQKRPWKSRDLLWLEIDHFTLINVYSR